MKEALLVYESEYKMKNWKGVAIYPKVLKDKRLSEFTDKEKEHLTRVGFRWYVYFYFRNPDTDEFKRHNAATLGINRNYKDFESRYRAVKVLKETTIEALEKGFSPHTASAIQAKAMSIKEAIDYAMSNKKATISSRSYNTYLSKVNIFKAYLKKRGVLDSDISKFNHQYVREHLIEVSKETSVANSSNS